MSSVDGDNKIARSVDTGHGSATDTKTRPTLFRQKSQPSSSDITDRLDSSGGSKPDSQLQTTDIKVLEKLIQEVKGLTPEEKEEANEEYTGLRQAYEEVIKNPSQYPMFKEITNSNVIDSTQKTRTLKDNAPKIGKVLEQVEKQPLPGISESDVEEGWKIYVMLLNAEFFFKLNQNSKMDKNLLSVPGERLSKSYTAGHTPQKGKQETGQVPKIGKAHSFTEDMGGGKEGNLGVDPSEPQSGARQQQQAKGAEGKRCLHGSLDQPKQDSQVSTSRSKSPLEYFLSHVQDSEQKQKAFKEYHDLVACYKKSYGSYGINENSISCSSSSEIEDISGEQKSMAPGLYHLLEFEKGKTANHVLKPAIAHYLKLAEHKAAYNKKLARSHNQEKSQGQHPTGTTPGAEHLNKSPNIQNILKYAQCKNDKGFEHLRSKARNDLQRLHHSERKLKKLYPQEMNIVTTVTGPDDIPDHQDASALYHFLRRLPPGHKEYVEAWKEYDVLLQSEQLLIMAQIANPLESNIQPQVEETESKHKTEKQAPIARSTRGSITKSHLLISREKFKDLQDDLRKKNEQIDDLTTRLSRFASQLLLDNNPNIADLSDKNRPTKLGEMFGILFDDQWTEAFEAIRESGSLPMRDELRKDILTLLLNIVMSSFHFCQKETINQLAKVKDSVACAFCVGDYTIEQEKNDKVAEELSLFTTRQAKLCVIKAAGICHKNATKAFIKKGLTGLVNNEKLRNEARVLAYVEKCVELCWFMCVQDPPMVLKCPGKGEPMNKSAFSVFSRKGSTVELCVWPAVFLYNGGPLVNKGYILPEEEL